MEMAKNEKNAISHFCNFPKKKTLEAILDACHWTASVPFQWGQTHSDERKWETYIVSPILDDVHDARPHSQKPILWNI